MLRVNLRTLPSSGQGGVLARQGGRKERATLASFRGAEAPRFHRGRKASPRENGVRPPTRSYGATGYIKSDPPDGSLPPKPEFSKSIRPSPGGRTPLGVSTTLADSSARFKLAASTVLGRVALNAPTGFARALPSSGQADVEVAAFVSYTELHPPCGERSSAGRASVCGTEGRGFKSHRSPQNIVTKCGDPAHSSVPGNASCEPRTLQTPKGAAPAHWSVTPAVNRWCGMIRFCSDISAWDYLEPRMRHPPICIPILTDACGTIRT